MWAGPPRPELHLSPAIACIAMTFGPGAHGPDWIPTDLDFSLSLGLTFYSSTSPQLLDGLPRNLVQAYASSSPDESRDFPVFLCSGATSRSTFYTHPVK